MDANQTRFHLLLGRADWGLDPEGDRLIDAAVEWNDSDATVRLRQLPFVFPGRRGDSPPALAQRRGAGRDRYGNWYWIAESGSEIRFRSGEAEAAEHFWGAADAIGRCLPAAGAGFVACPPAPEPRELLMSGLAVTEEHYLVVGLAQPAGLLLFDLLGGGAPQTLQWPREAPFSPFDIVSTAHGGVWILDRDNRRLWRLDRFLRVRGAAALPRPVEPTFVALEGQPLEGRDCQPSAPITTDMAIALDAVDPIAIDVLPDGSVVVLDDNGPERSLLHRLRGGVALGAPIPLDEELRRSFVPRPEGAASPYRAHDLAFVPAPATEPGAGILYVVGADGNQAFAFSVVAGEELRLALLPQYLPMRLFGGKALVRAGDRAYYDSGERWVALAEQPRPLYVRSAVLQLPRIAATVDAESAAFDGKEPDCVWHRLLIDACVPAAATVSVESRAANTLDDLAAAAWRIEPVPYLRGDGSEMPNLSVPTVARSRAGTWELLLQQAVGRYAQLRLTLSGSGRTTPRLHALRLYYPRFSYLRKYLPAVYQDDPTSAGFLDRFLANIEGFYTVLEGKIEHVQALFDQRTVPAAYLEWLAGWIGASVDVAWSEATRRLFLKHAPQMFRERGTRNGLIRALRLNLDACPGESIFDGEPGTSCCSARASFAGAEVRVVERFLTRRAPGVVFGDPTDVLGPGASTSSARWCPAHGAEPLHQRFREYLRQRYGEIAALNAAWETTFSSFEADDLVLPPVRPEHPTRSADWELFLRAAIGFTYAPVTTADAPLYRDFLARRYRNIRDLQAAYGSIAASWSSFAAVPLPMALPAGGSPLRDWITFVSLVVPTQRNAHRFTVLVPATLEEPRADSLRRLEVARRIAALERPAHTDFEVKLYWAIFRVGGARLGIDTVIGRGSRFAALVLDRDALGAGYLGYLPPWNAHRGTVVGRDGVSEASSAAAAPERMI